MAIGKHTSLEEAQKEKKLDRFCKEHPSTGDEDAFDSLFNAMATKKKPADAETSTQDNDAC
jgi:hypothetical protein